MNNHQVVIIGGGMVGAALALGLAKQGMAVALVENNQPVPFEKSQSADLRISAVSMASVELLTELGCWEAVVSMRACPYRRLETWEDPECRTRFSADHLGLEQLGFMVENRVLQLALWQSLINEPSVTFYCPDMLQSFRQRDDSVELILGSGEKITAQWIIGADGADSKVRQLAGIGVTAWDYRQHCMLINIDTHREQQDITWQRFYPSGPRSFLPFVGSQASLVWYDAPQRIKQLMMMDNSHLEEAIKVAFPDELGEFTVLNKGGFPLVRRHAQHYSKGRAVIVGDAAHTINPLAGQGVNLGFKDVKSLLQKINKASGITEEGLKKYYRHRVVDNLAMQSGMDFFYKTFSNELGPVKLARNALLKFADRSGPIKKEVLKYAIGLK
ncbi:2-octaprenyl-3-methyl-6-methoxy-1,4-benzoquinol hydroxylase [Vibrio salinus]|uniref:2-octaprenyl-3-methyl-6-methoxy-1,4-benzoquinol hydroxylase n=1 Tax=Vibrio salinus TaxID=2899784 RepID=UPI001E422A44|nr:2-octaprenyl-3-methyl-6-methoxy-1,4-benzoquinol hydroxylase [Vibrio salinus]MCE0493010.1 2-octaprenyl-3-methyl-6-methoxy-1,4-benzoquinol hydroxylase [Vibrio salinus]